MEGATLSLDGKANRLTALIRGNLAMAMQGLAVVPLFAGFDLHAGYGRIFSYDVTGGRYEETAFHSVGSGSLFARGSLKKLLIEGELRVTGVDTHSQDILWLEAELDSVKPKKAVDHQPGADQEHQRKRDLPDHEQLAYPKASADRGGLLFQDGRRPCT